MSKNRSYKVVIRDDELSIHGGIDTETESISDILSATGTDPKSNALDALLNEAIGAPIEEPAITQQPQQTRPTPSSRPIQPTQSTIPIPPTPPTPSAQQSRPIQPIQPTPPIQQNTPSRPQQLTESGSTYDDFLSNIRNHLSRWDTIDTFADIQPTPVLKLGSDTSINVECLLSHFTSDPLFLNETKQSCSDSIKNYLRSNNELDLASMINLADDQKFLNASEFYKNLYGFNIAMFDWIKNHESDLKKLKATTIDEISNGTYNFVDQTLKYTTNYMEKYQVYDKVLLSNTYDLLYILHVLNTRKINNGKSLNELEQTYYKLIDVVKENVALYKKLELPPRQVVSPSGISTTEIDDVINKLTQRITLLQQQRDEMKQQISDLNNATIKINSVASEHVKQLFKSDDLPLTETIASASASQPIAQQSASVSNPITEGGYNFGKSERIGTIKSTHYSVRNSNNNNSAANSYNRTPKSAYTPNRSNNNSTTRNSINSSKY